MKWRLGSHLGSFNVRKDRSKIRILRITDILPIVFVNGVEFYLVGINVKMLSVINFIGKFYLYANYILIIVEIKIFIIFVIFLTILGMH